MANTLTNLIPHFYDALNITSRERVGFISAARTDNQLARAAKDQTVYVPVAPTRTGASNTPGVNAPDTGDATYENVAISISKSEHVPIRFNGEEVKGLSNGGIYMSLLSESVAEAMRYLTNQIETDLYVAAYKAASRAYGTAGTTPFGTAGDLTDMAKTLEILEANGAPSGDLQYVLSSAALANLRGKMTNLFKVNEAGSSDMLRNGMTERLHGFAIRHSGQITTHTKGTGTSYLVNNASGEAIGDTALTTDTGSGTILAGDIITFAADTTNKYVSGAAHASNTLTLNKPGLKVLIPDNNAITVGNSYTPCVAFSRSALILATRPPAMPEGGDMAVDMTTVTDPVSGLSFEIALYKQFLQNVLHVRLAWGVAAIKPAHIALTLG